MSSDDQLRKAIDSIFDKYDKDKNGTLDQIQIRILIEDAFKSLNKAKKVSEEDVNQFIGAIDKNGDKQITKPELFDILKQLIKENEKKN